MATTQVPKIPRMWRHMDIFGLGIIDQEMYVDVISAFR